MSWLSRLPRWWCRKESTGVIKAKQEERLSKDRLEEALELKERIDDVTKSLNTKNYKNGWGEVIAETMRRAR